jgi:hypothetical protein
VVACPVPEPVTAVVLFDPQARLGHIADERLTDLEHDGVRSIGELRVRHFLDHLAAEGPLDPMGQPVPVLVVGPRVRLAGQRRSGGHQCERNGSKQSNGSSLDRHPGTPWR